MLAEKHRLMDTDILKMAALRSVLEELEDADRMLVALHYGGDLTREELAEEFEISLGQISLELRLIRLNLCDRMRARGFEETAVNSELLTAALMTGQQAPPELFIRLQRKIELMAFGSRSAGSADENPLWACDESMN